MSFTEVYANHCNKLLEKNAVKYQSVHTYKNFANLYSLGEKSKESSQNTTGLNIENKEKYFDVGHSSYLVCKSDKTERRMTAVYKFETTL